MSSKGFIVAGTQSGVGKTTITLGLLAALVRRGLRVASCKIGPDFIDPGHHKYITGKISRNLDYWMLSPETNHAIFHMQAYETDCVVVEGVMGLFDGAGPNGLGSTAQVAKSLSLPVLLVINARGLAQSAGAILHGFTKFDEQLSIKWVVFNNVGSQNHLRILRESISHLPHITCLGGIPKHGDISLPQRHLGLVTAEDVSLSVVQIQKLAELIETHLDLDLLLKEIPAISPLHGADYPDYSALFRGRGHGHRVKIAVARDTAFCFYYQENLELLQNAGAELVFFSPLQDERLPEDIGGIYIGGGYPELHAGRLATNMSMKRSIFAAFEADMPIYAECGGFMYLCDGIKVDDSIEEMVGIFPFQPVMMERFASLGYREVILKADSLLGRAGQVIRGHEFHYSKLQPEISHGAVLNGSISQIYEVRNAMMQPIGSEGFRSKNAIGSYIHLHFASNFNVANGFVQACERFISSL